MGRDVFRGTIRPLRTNDSAYGSSPPRSHDLLDEILEVYHSADNLEIRKGEEEKAEFNLKPDLLDRLTTGWEGSGQELLDSLFVRLRKSDHFHMKHSPILINILMKTFYERGARALSADYNSLSTRIILHTGKHLVGTEDKPLRIHYLLNPRDGYAGGSVGDFAKHCEFDIKGGVFSVGDESKDCIFIMDSLPQYMGINATGCDFYLDLDSDAICERVGKDHITIGFQGHDKQCDMLTDFFEDNNSVYVPDEDGWRELRPS